MTATTRTVPVVRTGRLDLAVLLAALAACVAGLVAGVVGGPLWLDEAISVEIARRPVPELLEALRQDGSPPLYYLLLHGWMAAFGTGTVAVRLLTVLLVPIALWLAWLLGRRVGGEQGRRVGGEQGRRVGGEHAGGAAVVALAALPWTMRYGSETRMYLLVVVLVLAGALALLAVRERPGRAAVAGLAGCVAALLLTHYWALFLLAVVAVWHAPAALRREPGAVRVTVAFVVGGLAFLPWLPTFLYQAAHTGAPWATPPGVVDLLRTPLYWGGGPDAGRVALAAVLVPLVVLAAVRLRAGRALVGVAGGSLALAWAASLASGGAYTGRYTAVVVPLVAVAAGLGATTLPGRWGVAALAALVAVGGVTGVRAVVEPRASAAGVAERFLGAAEPGDVLVYCPDQLGPPVAREIGPGYRQVVYPTLAGPELVDWVDYAERNAAASPADVAEQVDALAAGRQLFVLKASGYRTYARQGVDDCDALLAEVSAVRGAPAHLFGELGTTGQLLFRFDP